jgi:hypothetical protein
LHSRVKYSHLCKYLARILQHLACSCLFSFGSPIASFISIRPKQAIRTEIYPQVTRMRRLIYLLILVLFVSVSATCVNASTDCERWYIAYRSELAHTRSLQRIAAAKRRARLYAQRKLAGYVAPTPKPKLVLAKSPRMPRKQTLHHFDLACGVLPEDGADTPVIAEETPTPFDEHALNDGIDLLPAGLGDMIAQNDVPPFTNESSPSYPSGGGSPIYTPPFTGGITPPSGPPSGPPVTPPIVPEPSSYILVLTGMVGAAGEIRRRFKL